MAVTSTYIGARLRLTDGETKTICTYSNVKPDAAAGDYMKFTEGFAALRNKGMGFTYLITDSLLEDN